VLHRRPPKDIRTLRSLDAMAEAIAAWRAAHPADS
jgi:hypothetical protein